MAVLAPRWAAARPQAEWVCALALIGAVTAAGGAALRAYESVILPTLVQPSVPAAPRGVPAADRAAVERFQLSNDLLGEAIAYRNSKHQEWADATLARVLALDPSHPTALLLQEQWAVEPPPQLTDAERVTRERARRLSELLGAAASLEEAGMADEAAQLRVEAAALP